MTKKTSGLGRGLGDLLDDNAPEVRGSGTVIRHDGDGDVSISPERVEGTEIIHTLSTDYREPQVHKAVTPITAYSSDMPLTVEDIREAAEEKGETVTVGNAVTEREEAEPQIREAASEAEVQPQRSRSLKALFREYK